jgi:hypothetical protein
MWSNINKYLKSEIKLFVNSHILSLLLGQHCILLCLFANIPFKIGQMGSAFMINDVQIILKNKALFDQIVIIYWPMVEWIFPVKNE